MNLFEQEFIIHPIGFVKREKEGLFLHFDKNVIPALKQLEHFSHIHVFWWADKHDNEKSRGILDCTPPYGENPPVTGVFATRAEYRPNPIAVTIAKIENIDHNKGIIKIQNIDAFDDTPIIDIKAYFPVCDRVENARIPDWIQGWPETFPDEGFGLYEG